MQPSHQPPATNLAARPTPSGQQSLVDSNRPFHTRPTLAQWLGMIDGLLERHECEGLDLVVIDPLSLFLPGNTEQSSVDAVEAGRSDVDQTGAENAWTRAATNRSAGLAVYLATFAVPWQSWQTLPDLPSVTSVRALRELPWSAILPSTCRLTEV